MYIQDPHATTFGAAPPKEEYRKTNIFDRILLICARGAIIYLLLTYLATEFRIGISL